ncbi:MAG: hypothetical protein AAF614_16250 [Chloroflexota bacterium]
MTNVIIPQNSHLYQTFEEAAHKQRIVLFAGLPGVGKSLFVQQMALMAHEMGRAVQLLQWDVARMAFETDAILAKYPEIDGLTQPIIRKAVGMWARQGVWQWHQAHPEKNHILVGEVPLVGNRLIELVQKQDDEVEPLLRSEQTQFFLPVPSREIRAIIEAARAKSIANPQHEKEVKDAPPNVLQLNWLEANELAYQLGLLNEPPVSGMAYDPEVYTAVYRYLLQHRQHQVLSITETLKSGRSVYDLEVAVSDIQASPQEASRIMEHLETDLTLEEIAHAVAQWHII